MSDEVTVTFNDKDFQDMMKRLKDLPTVKGHSILTAMALYYQKQITKTFKLEGARDGLPKWDERAQSTIKTPAGTRRLSYGTDMVPRLTRQQFGEAMSEAIRIGWWHIGKKGYFPGYGGLRRYRATRPVLQVSGGLKAMFTQIRHLGDRVVVGAPRLIKAGKKYVATSELISKYKTRPARPVITITDGDRAAMAATVVRAIHAAVSK